MLQNPPIIVFITAYDEYAIRAFEVNALDYLLKPFSSERLEQAIRQANDEYKKGRVLLKRLAPLLEDLADHGNFLKRLSVFDGDHIRVINTETIDWTGIENEKCYVHAGNKTYFVRHSLRKM